MKKQLTVILLSALILSGCASGRMGNPGAIMAGASIGGSLGSSIGGLIGWLEGRLPWFCYWEYCGNHCRCGYWKRVDGAEARANRGRCVYS